MVECNVNFEQRVVMKFDNKRKNNSGCENHFLFQFNVSTGLAVIIRKARKRVNKREKRERTKGETPDLGFLGFKIPKGFSETFSDFLD